MKAGWPINCPAFVMNNTEYPQCKYCRNALTQKMKRSWFARTFFLFIPIEKYYCNTCGKSCFTWIQEP
jgi:hypothetical protein